MTRPDRLLLFARAFVLGHLLALILAAPLPAQWRPEATLPAGEPALLRWDPPALRMDTVRPGPTGAEELVLAGAAASALGSFGGAFLGYHLDRGVFNWGCERGCEDPGSWGLFGGWFAGSALTTPLAVHLANRSRGSLRSGYLASALIAGAGMAGLLGIGSPGGAYVILGAPLVQVVSAVLVEHGTTR